MNEDWVRMQSITNNPDHLSLFLSGGFYYLDDGKASTQAHFTLPIRVIVLLLPIG
ncbi:MAG: hypothetical protein WBE61_00770 [Nitrososphaeraceae archaeon]